jgi:hypothetical protein
VPLRDQTGQETDRAVIELDPVLQVSKVVVKHDAVIIYDAAGKEALEITHPSYPGAGLALDIADHVATV